jgi:replicative superfamily II helicase
VHLCHLADCPVTSPVSPDPTGAPEGTASVLHFPLFDRARQSGVFDGKSALIIAPTATGKSYIGREAIRRAIERKDAGTHVYLVPYRALADAVFECFVDLLKATEVCRASAPSP